MNDNPQSGPDDETQPPASADSPSGRPAKKTSGRQARKTPVKKAPAQKAPAQKAAARKAPVQKAPAQKSASVRKSASAVSSGVPAKRASSTKKRPTEAAAPASAQTKAEPVTPETTTPEAITPTAAELIAAEPIAAEPIVNEPIVNESIANEPASAEDVEKAWKDNRLAQVLYHDWEASTYDEKWSISFDDRCITYARDRFSVLVGPQVLRTEAWPYAKSLEIGAGTGFFSLNLKQAGVLGEVHVSDVSGGMVESAKQNALKLGFEVQGAVAEAESLPYEDDTFDVVIGHAVIHHIPDVEVAFREVLRVLKPGGRFVIAGEPTRIGDWYARWLGRITWEVTTRVTAMQRFKDKWARSQEELDESSRAAALESIVDLHTFVPVELRAMATRAGAVEVRTQTEELLAAFVGWPVRTFEAAVNPKALGWGWAMFAFNSWKRLSALDRVLSRVVPESAFYNVGITGVKPTR